MPADHPGFKVGFVAASRDIDEDFLALPRLQLADAALGAAFGLGASHADMRIHRMVTEHITMLDGRLQSATVSQRLGVAVRVIVAGTWGFAGHPELSPDAVANTARLAVEVARRSYALNSEPARLAAEPVYRNAQWASTHLIDPFEVTVTDKIAVLQDYSDRVLTAVCIDHVSAGFRGVKEQTFYADSHGSAITQQRVRVAPELEATAVDTGAGSFHTMRTLAPPTARGWEAVVDDDVWDWSTELSELPELLAEKVSAPSATPGRTDLVIDTSNLWLTIHETVGHATEYDRALGRESDYAGTSFATPELLGRLCYGSPAMTVTADRTAEFGLATVGFDDEGVAAQSWDLVRDGIFVGYQIDRMLAPQLGEGRSSGCSYAESPYRAPLQRMANVSLRPADSDVSTQDLVARVERGLYVVGDKSWSIDMQRYNFQFTGQRFFAIRNGVLSGQVRDVAYQSTTTDFWGALEAVGGPSTWRLGGAFNCGKGQPSQAAPVSHGCPSALFRGIRVVNTRARAGP